MQGCYHDLLRHPGQEDDQELTSITLSEDREASWDKDREQVTKIHNTAAARGYFLLHFLKILNGLILSWKSGVTFLM